MEINMKKLKQYIKEDKIVEFNSDKECMEYFNTYDYQGFLNVEEMKKFQGKYGFNIGEKRYHIDYEEALDIWEEETENAFTNEELYMLSDGLLSLIRCNNEAAKLTYDRKSIQALKESSEKYQRLNRKICEMIESD